MGQPGLRHQYHAGRQGMGRKRTALLRYLPARWIYRRRNDREPCYRPFFEVERRKYRFRILNASVSRFFKYGLSDGSPMIQIANDGNLLPQPVTQIVSDEQGIAERYDWVIDFSRYNLGDKVWLVNVCE